MSTPDHSSSPLQPPSTQYSYATSPLLPSSAQWSYWFVLHAIIVPVLFASISLVGLVGNLLVIYVILSNARMRTVINLLLLNLAVADLCFVIVVPPLTAHEYLGLIYPLAGGAEGYGGVYAPGGGGVGNGGGPKAEYFVSEVEEAYASTGPAGVNGRNAMSAESRWKRTRNSEARGFERGHKKDGVDFSQPLRNRGVRNEWGSKSMTETSKTESSGELGEEDSAYDGAVYASAVDSVQPSSDYFMWTMDELGSDVSNSQGNHSDSDALVLKPGEDAEDDFRPEMSDHEANYDTSELQLDYSQKNFSEYSLTLGTAEENLTSNDKDYKQAQNSFTASHPPSVEVRANTDGFSDNEDILTFMRLNLAGAHRRSETTPDKTKRSPLSTSVQGSSPNPPHPPPRNTSRLSSPPPSSFQTFVDPPPPWGEESLFACKLLHYCVNVTAYSTVYTLVLIAALRYMTVVHNVRTLRLRTQRNAILLIAALWALSLLLNIPVISVYTLHPPTRADQSEARADQSGDQSEARADHLSEPSEVGCAVTTEEGQRLFVVFFLFAYLLPLLVIALFSAAILRHLAKHRSEGVRQGGEAAVPIAGGRVAPPDAGQGEVGVFGICLAQPCCGLIGCRRNATVECVGVEEGHHVTCCPPLACVYRCGSLQGGGDQGVARLCCPITARRESVGGAGGGAGSGAGGGAREDRRRCMSGRTAEMKRQASRLIVLVVVMFAVSWLPINVHLLVTFFIDPPTRHALHSSALYITFVVLCNCCAYVNSCVNPFIYSRVSKDFRDSFRDAVGCRRGDDAAGGGGGDQPPGGQAVPLTPLHRHERCHDDVVAETAHTPLTPQSPARAEHRGTQGNIQGGYTHDGYIQGGYTQDGVAAMANNDVTSEKGGYAVSCCDVTDRQRADVMGGLVDVRVDVDLSS